MYYEHNSETLAQSMNEQTQWKQYFTGWKQISSTNFNNLTLTVKWSINWLLLRNKWKGILTRIHWINKFKKEFSTTYPMACTIILLRPYVINNLHMKELLIKRINFDFRQYLMPIHTNTMVKNGFNKKSMMTIFYSLWITLNRIH